MFSGSINPQTYPLFLLTIQKKCSVMKKLNAYTKSKDLKEFCHHVSHGRETNGEKVSRELVSSGEVPLQNRVKTLKPLPQSSK